MASLHRGKQTIVFDRHPVIVSSAAVGGKKESEGPLARFFDRVEKDNRFGQKTWEKAESCLQQHALATAAKKVPLSPCELDVLFAGDLLNQCIGSAFAIRDTQIPFLGLYGACSTMAESLTLAAAAVNAGYAHRAAALTSSHFAAAERQYRFPLGYGGQRTPTAQWTVTGSGCCIVAADGRGPFLNCATVGRIEDYGIRDANNMGAAMAPAAYSTLRAHFADTGLRPRDYDLIVTGDLGSLGSRIVVDLFHRDGVEFGENYRDCGVLIYDAARQDVHAGGSGCGCGASVLCGYLLSQLRARAINSLLFCATGALMSPVSSWQGESIPAICHAVSISNERR